MLVSPCRAVSPHESVPQCCRVSRCYQCRRLSDCVVQISCCGLEQFGLNRTIYSSNYCILFGQDFSLSLTPSLLTDRCDVHVFLRNYVDCVVAAAFPTGNRRHRHQSFADCCCSYCCYCCDCCYCCCVYGVAVVVVWKRRLICVTFWRRCHCWRSVRNYVGRNQDTKSLNYRCSHSPWPTTDAAFWPLHRQRRRRPHG